MPLRVEEFVERLSASEVLSPADLAQVRAETSDSEDAATHAARHVDSGLLTPYQAEVLLAGTGEPLVLGEYVLLERIGEGGMGQVFKARHRRMGRVVAVKILPASATRKPSSI